MTKRQREYLVAVCEKVAVYTLTIGILARFLDKDLSGLNALGLIGASGVTLWLGYWFAKGES